MFCANKNSYLQLVCSLNPGIINNAVDQAMQMLQPDHRVDAQPTELEPMQPSLYGPHVDITRSNIGYGQIGLRNLIQDLHSPAPLDQLQALHSVMDQVQISENAVILIKFNIVDRLINLMKHDNPIIREKVCLIYTHLVGYYQGRRSILIRPIIIDNLIWLVTEENKKEIRYAAAYTLWIFSRYLCTCEELMKNNSIVENLLKRIKKDYRGIVVIHLKTLANLTEWDPERAIRANAFRILRVLFHAEDERIVSAAMDVLAEICKHKVGRKLSDIHYTTWKVRKYLTSPHISVVNSAAGILQFTTLTTRAQCRAREFGNELTKHLVHLCQTPNMPQLQLRCMQILLNLSAHPDIRRILKGQWYGNIKAISISSPQQWDDASEMISPGLDTGDYYRPIEEAHGADVVNARSYTRKLHKLKEDLIRAIESKPYMDDTFE